jgi:hypothetical protein
VLFDGSGRPAHDPKEDDGLELDTKRGNHINNYQPMEEPSPRLRAFVDMHAGIGRGLRSITATYNCVGMVFAARRTWIDSEYIRFILHEDGYRRLANESEVSAGDVVVYTDDDGDAVHVGLVWSVNRSGAGFEDKMMILSKWGYCGEYLHGPYNVCDGLGIPSEFWSDRIVI